MKITVKINDSEIAKLLQSKLESKFGIPANRWKVDMSQYYGVQASAEMEEPEPEPKAEFDLGSVAA